MHVWSISMLAVLAFCIYTQHGEGDVKRGGWNRCIKYSWKLHCWSWKIMEKSWNCVFEFLWEPCNLLNSLQETKCSASLAFSHFFPTCLINSIKHEHSCKILYVHYQLRSTGNFEWYFGQVCLNSDLYRNF